MVSFPTKQIFHTVQRHNWSWDDNTSHKLTKGCNKMLHYYAHRYLLSLSTNTITLFFLIYHCNFWGKRFKTLWLKSFLRTKKQSSLKPSSMAILHCKMHIFSFSYTSISNSRSKHLSVHMYLFLQKFVLLKGAHFHSSEIKVCQMFILLIRVHSPGMCYLLSWDIMVAFKTAFMTFFKSSYIILFILSLLIQSQQSISFLFICLFL